MKKSSSITPARTAGNWEVDRFSIRSEESGSDFPQCGTPDIAESPSFFSPTYLRRCAGPRRRGDKRAGRIWPDGWTVHGGPLAMRTIFRRKINIDLQGKLWGDTQQRLSDDENGNIEELEMEAVWSCEACGHPISRIEDIRGVCGTCLRQTCSTCEDRCDVCRSTLCPHCRQGFPEKGLSVCDNCRGALDACQVRENQLLEDKLAFERLMAVYGAQTRLIQAGMYDQDSMSGAIGRLLQMRLSRKLSQIEQQISGEQDHVHKRLR